MARRRQQQPRQCEQTPAHAVQAVRRGQRASPDVPVAVAVLALSLPLLATCGRAGAAVAPEQVVLGGDAERGRAAIHAYGCGACHEIPGAPGARGRVGPPLAGIASRAVIGGRLANTPENLIHWIREPQSVSPGTVMPDMGVTEADARDIAAYLYTLR